MKPLKTAILGATGAVGQEFLSLLDQREFPLAELRLLASKKSAGKKIVFRGKEITIEEARPDSFTGLDLVLSSAGGAISRELAPHAVKAGALVVDNTSAFRMDPNVPLVVPEINPQEIAKHKGIIANPNCSTIIMLVPVFPLYKLSRIKRIVVSTYQAVSGAGQRAMDELRLQAAEFLAGKPLTREVFPHQVAFNLFSHNTKLNSEGFCEEETKMIKETHKILGDAQISIFPTTIRVPVFRAHSESILIEQEKSISLEDARKAIAAGEGLRLVDDSERNHFPMPIEAEGRDEILVGRLRKDPACANSLGLFVSGDQIRKGAALNAVQIAELWAGIPRPAVLR
ncbi:MAG: aspartate-semialdehyde dehydrogenase [Omnitrophica bacterium GWA2_52_12]|nr:MAG: aspartate-semialdehyde dehydrogenase [Omnitrophica bacterium GWA2_52_12]